MKQPVSVSRYIDAALAGLVATVPMTAVIVLWNRNQRGAEELLPPERVTLNIAKKLGFHSEMDPLEKGEAIALSHFAYGAGAGAVYAPLAARAPGHPALKGALFGLLVWTLSYLGWLPLTKVMPPATRHSANSNAMMIVAHLIWGAVTGMLLERWQSEDGNANE